MSDDSVTDIVAVFDTIFSRPWATPFEGLPISNDAVRASIPATARLFGCILSSLE
jgi:hypothetical protein